MLTHLGRILRKIRIDHGEILKNMSDKLGVTASYLSAIENGKRSVPASLGDQIVSMYGLDAAQETELRRAILETSDSLKLNLAGANIANKEVAFAFARKFSEMDEEMLNEFRKLLKGED